jgi:hypothetical protein
MKVHISSLHHKKLNVKQFRTCSSNCMHTQINISCIQHHSKCVKLLSNKHAPAKALWIFKNIFKICYSKSICPVYFTCTYTHTHTHIFVFLFFTGDLIGDLFLIDYFARLSFRETLPVCWDMWDKFSWYRVV